MKARHALLGLLVFGLGLAGLADAQRGTHGWRGRGLYRMRGDADAPPAQLRTGWRGRGGENFWGTAFACLDLSDEQKAQLRELRQQLREETASTLREIREKVQNGELTPQQAREQIQQIRENHRQALEEILTPEQKQKLRELQANRPMWRGRGFAPGDADSTRDPAAKSTDAAVESQSWGSIKKEVK